MIYPLAGEQDVGLPDTIAGVSACFIVAIAHILLLDRRFVAARGIDITSRSYMQRK